METIDNLFILEEIKKIEEKEVEEVEELYFTYVSNYYRLNKNSYSKVI